MPDIYFTCSLSFIRLHKYSTVYFSILFIFYFLHFGLIVYTVSIHCIAVYVFILYCAVTFGLMTTILNQYYYYYYYYYY